MVIIPGDMDNQEKENPTDLSHGLPTVLTALNLVKFGQSIRIKKNHLGAIKANTMLRLVGRVLLFIPFKDHS